MATIDRSTPSRTLYHLVAALFVAAGITTPSPVVRAQATNAATVAAVSAADDTAGVSTATIDARAGHALVASSDKAETPVTIEQITVAQANEIIRNRVGDLAVEERVRVFQHGVQLDLDPAALTVIRDAADYEAQTGLLVFYGKIGTTEVTEDLRVMLHGDLAYVLRDIYIDPTDETVFIGRSIPSPLDAKRGF